MDVEWNQQRSRGINRPSYGNVQRISWDTTQNMRWVCREDSGRRKIQVLQIVNYSPFFLHLGIAISPRTPVYLAFGRRDMRATITPRWAPNEKIQQGFRLAGM